MSTVFLYTVGNKLPGKPPRLGSVLLHEVIVFVLLAGMSIDIIALCDPVNRFFCSIVNTNEILSAAGKVPAIYVPHLQAS